MAGIDPFFCASPSFKVRDTGFLQWRFRCFSPAELLALLRLARVVVLDPAPTTEVSGVVSRASREAYALAYPRVPPKDTKFSPKGYRSIPKASKVEGALRRVLCGFAFCS